MNVLPKKHKAQTLAPGLTAKEQAELEEVFKQFSALEKVILFGSRAMGNHKQGSDVDLAVKGILNQDTVFKIKDLLEESTTLPYFFDVVDYQTIKNPALKNHINKDGVEIYRIQK